MIEATQAQRRQLALENREYGDALEELPEIRWKSYAAGAEKQPFRVLRSRGYAVWIYADGGQLRMTVNRTKLRADGKWEDGITWDTLQRLKAEAGYGDRWAVEVFPPSDRVVNVANMRHLWLLDEAPSFAWRVRA